MRQDEMPLETTCPPFYLMQKQEGNDNGTTGGGGEVPQDLMSIIYPIGA